jgi:secreted PhoX family phosphatase
MPEFTRRTLMATTAAASLGASVSGSAVAAEDEDGDTPKAPRVRGNLERFATTALGAEVTGPEVTASGSLFFSLQHPSRENSEPFDKAGIGYVAGYDVMDPEFDELSIPTTNDEQSRVRVGSGEYTLLAQEGDTISDGETLGVPTTPDGASVDEFAGSRYSELGYNPDLNRLVPTNEAETEGYLYTNWEQSPGSLSKMPVSQNEDGTWEADLENTTNLASTEAFRSIGGTRINCYGDLSPWGTPLSAEEEYSHPRASLLAKTSGFEETDGPAHRGAAQFYNRPNPTEIQSAVDEYYGDDSWTVQGYWALGGLELLAYYLGADPVDQDGDTNTTTPIDGPYPNPYRYGYIVDFREPTAETPKPVKYHVMGRAAWECPDVQSDKKTVYLTSDGDDKGFYKFVADRPIPSYQDPMDVAGTLYVAQVANKEAAADNPPAEVDLELDWIELGSASNGEAAEWIAEYDDVDQVCYLETHAETDWQEDFETALEEADKAVVENGNQNYIADEEIVEWARQWKANGPDGVDEELRKIPFLETRAAAKEVGGTVEFRKSEGIDSADGAKPGDYVYIGISEVNTGMSDDEGDVRVDRVDGGLVYRAELEPDYNISTLEPVIVGPDATDTADVANDALVNVDNLFALNDGRVLCCEDADKYGRSYPNDCLYVYTPPEWTENGKANDGNEGTSGDEDGDSEN